MMLSRRILVACSVVLSIGLLERCAIGQDQTVDLTVTFEYLPDAPTSTDSVVVQIGFAGGGIGVDVGSTVLPQLEIVGNDLFLTITVEPPPPSEIVLPAFFELNPVVDLGTFSPGQYRLYTEVFGYTGESSFAVVPEPSSLFMSVLVGLSISLGYRSSRKPS